MISAAGILILDKDGRALFLKRGAGGDNPGEWCFPGGRLEDGETAIEAAVRETMEEAGFSAVPAKLTLWSRRIANRETTGAAPTHGPGESVVNAAGGAPLPITMPPGEVVVAEGQVDFTTFMLRDVEQFVPDIDASGEHVAYAWAPVDQPPEPLHPGCRVALGKLAWDELGIARAIAAGDLTSPQRYENVSLFDLRITGTGTAYRKALDEFVYRAPENYLTDEFLARCNGLPVIFEHPTKNTLSSKEFADRMVGTILLPYIKGNEVWGIAKIYDDATIELMNTEQLSTSPAVVFRDPSVNSTVKLDDGKTLLIEGKPSLLDHLAICERGVWDKGGSPTGVSSTTQEIAMTEEELKAKADAEAKERDDRAKADAESGEKLDKILKCVDLLATRMDSFEAKEKARADAEETERKAKADAAMDEPARLAADKARKDSEEETKREEERKAKADADEKEKADLKERLDSLEKSMPKAMSDAETAAMADAQAKADSVAQAFGDSAPRPLQGETLLAYRRRLVGKFQAHSKPWKEVDLGAIADSAAFAVAEGQIYADAMIAARNPADIPADMLLEHKNADVTGRLISTFSGQPSAWMSAFSANRRRLTGIRNA